VRGLKLRYEMMEEAVRKAGWKHGYRKFNFKNATVADNNVYA